MINSFLRSGYIILLLGILGAIGCFPNFEATTIQRESMKESTNISTPTKVYLLDASVVLFPKGFSVHNDTVIGQGARFWIDKSDSLYRNRSIPLDSIIAMTSYKSHVSFGRAIGSFLLGVTGTVMTPLSIYCIACPKCCFGSCPTVYTVDRSGASLQAELFSHSVSRLLEDDDLDKIDYTIDRDHKVQLLVTNEALETHCINTLALLAVEHPKRTIVFPSPENKFVLFRDLHPPKNAFDSDGRDISAVIAQPDSLAYRTAISRFPALAKRAEPDKLYLSIDVPKGTLSVKMLLRLRNTLLSTMLFYDVVLGSQGITALDWNHRMNTDNDYAMRFKKVYETFSGLSVDRQHGGEWMQVSRIDDVGPITWKYVAIEIPVTEAGQFNVRLRSFPDNFFIDYLAFDFHKQEADSVQVKELVPQQVFNNTGEERQDILSSLQMDDDNYLVTNPGDSYRFLYHIEATNTSTLTLFVRSRGYYSEWIRGSWLKPSTAYRFDLENEQETLSHLVTSWLLGKDEIEQKFFQSRIPTRSSR